MKKLMLVCSLVFVFGCRTIVKREHVDKDTVEITTNAKCIVEYTKKADGEEIFKLDTSQQGMLDRMKTGLINLLNYLGRALDNVQPTIGEK